MSAETVKVREATVSVPAHVDVGAGSVAAPTVVFRNKSAMVRSAATAGLVGALLSLLPLGFLLGLPLAGFLSVLFYRRRTWGAEPSPGAGFALGTLTGIFGFAMFVVLMAADALVSHTGDEIRRQMIEAVHRAQLRSPDPQSRQLMEYFLTQQGMAVLMVLGLILVCIVFVLLGGVGGSLSAGLLRRKDPDK